MKRILVLLTFTAVLGVSCGRYFVRHSRPLMLGETDTLVVVCTDNDLRLAIENELVFNTVPVRDLESEFSIPVQSGNLHERTQLPSYSFSSMLSPTTE